MPRIALVGNGLTAHLMAYSLKSHNIAFTHYTLGHKLALTNPLILKPKTQSQLRELVGSSLYKAVQTKSCVIEYREIFNYFGLKYFYKDGLHFLSTEADKIVSTIGKNFNITPIDSVNDIDSADLILNCSSNANNQKHSSTYRVAYVTTGPNTFFFKKIAFRYIYGSCVLVVSSLPDLKYGLTLVDYSDPGHFLNYNLVLAQIINHYNLSFLEDSCNKDLDFKVVYKGSFSQKSNRFLSKTIYFGENYINLNPVHGVGLSLALDQVKLISSNINAVKICKNKIILGLFLLKIKIKMNYPLESIRHRLCGLPGLGLLNSLGYRLVSNNKWLLFWALKK